MFNIFNFSIFLNTIFMLQCAPHFVPISNVFIDWRFSCHVRKNLTTCFLVRNFFWRTRYLRRHYRDVERLFNSISLTNSTVWSAVLGWRLSPKAEQETETETETEANIQTSGREQRHRDINRDRDRDIDNETGTETETLKDRYTKHCINHL